MRVEQRNVNSVKTANQASHELIANWIINFNEKIGKMKFAEKRLAKFGISVEEFQKILMGDFMKYSFADLLELNKLLNGSTNHGFKLKP